MIQDQRSGENNEASNTVIIPVTAMARLLIAPSISPSSIALAVPIAWEEEPRARPFAENLADEFTEDVSKHSGDDDHSYRDRHIAAKFLGNAHSDRSSD